MNPEKIRRINELARKKKAGMLTEEEAAEQAALRKREAPDASCAGISEEQSGH